MNLKHFIFSALIATSMSANALEILEAKLDSSSENLIVTVKHGGGCGEHDYKLVVEECFETMPLQCKASIKHTTQDFCEAIIVREAKFNLKALGLTDSYFAGALLTIKGALNTSAAVRLDSKTQPTIPGSKARCLTHTGSTLEINDYIVGIITKDKKSQEYTIVNTDVLVLESLPPVYQTTLKLDDGRAIVTNFREGSKKGTGQFIRLDNSRSPLFECTLK